jgi:hypothetical protein
MVRFLAYTYSYVLILKVHSEAIVAITGALGALEPWRLTLEPWRLTLEPWRLTLEPWRPTLEPWRLTLEP